MKPWFVFIDPTLVSWIAKQPQNVFTDYVNAIEGIREIAKVFSKHSIVSCGSGFLIYVENQNTVLECAIFQDKKEIHVVRIIY
ncbi:MAG: hypothetical protein ACREBB_00885 [Nitrosotalea sp.]